MNLQQEKEILLQAFAILQQNYSNQNNMIQNKTAEVEVLSKKIFYMMNELSLMQQREQTLLEVIVEAKNTIDEKEVLISRLFKEKIKPIADIEYNKHIILTLPSIEIHAVQCKDNFMLLDCVKSFHWFTKGSMERSRFMYTVEEQMFDSEIIVLNTDKNQLCFALSGKGLVHILCKIMDCYGSTFEQIVNEMSNVIPSLVWSFY